MNALELKETILRYYKLHPELSGPYKKELDQLADAEDWYDVVFPYNWSKYDPNDLKFNIEHSDEVTVITSIKSPRWSLAFPKSYSDDDCKLAMHLLMLEQHEGSPHRYIEAPKDKAILDFGCSEGMYSNMYGDLSNDVYLFDEEYWMSAAVWNTHSSNIYFIPGLVTRDTQLNLELKQPIGMIKVDVEGMESDILTACKDLIVKYHPVIQLATYHYHDEFTNLIKDLVNLGYKVEDMESPKGFMIFPNDQNQYSPYFRKGLLIAK